MGPDAKRREGCHLNEKLDIPLPGIGGEVREFVGEAFPKQPDCSKAINSKSHAVTLGVNLHGSAEDSSIDSADHT